MPRTRTKKVGLRDVAGAAGVSIATVSRVLRGDESFTPATVQRVRAEARRLNYRPNATARNLQNGTTNLAGVSMPVDGFYGRIMNAISRRLFEAHCLIVFADASWDKGQKLEQDVVHQMVERMVDGIILRPSSEEIERSYYEEIWQRGIPLIVIDRELSLFKTDFVGSDDLGIGNMAAMHLIEQGHRRLLFCGDGIAHTSRMRGQGFRDVVSEHPDVAGRCVDASRDGWESVLALFEQADPPTGVFCYNDPVAADLLGRIQALGLRVPEDIAVIGCGQVFPHLPLTTFDQHEEEIGRQAAELYLRRVNQPGDRFAPMIVRVPATLVPGVTTASAPPSTP